MSFTEKEFYAEMQSFVDTFVEHFPVPATFLGDHRSSARLGDYSPEGVAKIRAWLDAWLVKFEGCNTSDWSVDGQIDCEMMAQFVTRAINGRLPFGYANYNWLDRNPVTAVYECIYGVYVVALRDQVEEETRLPNMISRLNEVPRVLAEGRALIQPELVPPVWGMVALEAAKEGSQMFAGLVPLYAQSVPAFAEALTKAGQAAAAAMQEHAAWIQGTVLPQAKGDFAIGKEEYDEILRAEHLVSYDSDQLLSMGWELYEEIKQEMEAVAAELDASKSPMELIDELHKVHPTADELLESYQKIVAEARQFVVDNKLVTLPDGEKIIVESTPLLLRPAIPYAATAAHSIFGEYQGRFVVTPVGQGEEAESKLQGHSRAQMPVTVAHEVYPGHHVQVTIARELKSLPRKLGGFLFPMTLGGWAWYSEELMEKAGFNSAPERRLDRLRVHFLGALWIIVDVSLHTKKMTIEEAIGFMIQNGVDAEYAKSAVPHYLLLPTDRQCYLMGKRSIQQLVAEYQTRFPGATLGEAHDAIMSCGLLPADLMRRRLFEAPMQVAAY